MSTNKVSISDIISIKGGSVEEFCICAKNKGIDIPCDPNYILSPSEVKIIEPLIAFNLKYGKIIQIKKDLQDNDCDREENNYTSKVFSTAMPSTSKKNSNVSGEINMSSLNQYVATKSDNEDKIYDVNHINKKQLKKQKSPKRVIGVVKFFDIYKGWGFVASSSKGISGKVEDEGKLFILYLTSSEWNGVSSPRGKEWILLTPRKTPRGWSALNAELMEYNRETLLFAMKYRGKYAKIYGTDNKGDSFDENILCHIIRKMTMVRTGLASYNGDSYDNSKFTEIIDCFCEYIGNISVERQESTVKQFLCDSELNALLHKIFSEGDYISDNDVRMASYSLFSHLLINQIFESGKLSDLSKLPDAFDYSPYVRGLTDILVNESVSDAESVEQWLINHDVINILTLDGTDVNTIPLRLILQRLTNNAVWLDSLNVDWILVREYFKSNSDIAYQYCRHFFADKDEDFIKCHDVCDILEDETIGKWCDNLFNEDDTPREFLRILLEHIDSLELWGMYVHRGFDVSSSYDVLSESISKKLLEKDVESVRVFLNICSEKEISIIDIIGKVEDLSDDIKAELFYLTENPVFYNALSRKSAVIEHVNNSGTLELRKFLKFCSKVLPDSIR